MIKTDDKTLISALRILVRDIQSDDGVANACIAEAADRLEELKDMLGLREACWEGIVIANKQVLDLTNELESVKKELTQWQPIDSAPKYETDIIIFCPYTGVATAKFYDRKWVCTANGGEKAISYMDYSTTEYHDDIKPTHWMQLPNSPK